MKINFGINRIVTKNKRRRIEHRCGKLEIDAVDHSSIIEAIRAKCPGWMITGYYVVEDNNGTTTQQAQTSSSCSGQDPAGS